MNPNELRKLKLESLFFGFKEIGLNPNNQVGQVELLQFLNRRARGGRFDPILSDKLFQVLSIDYNSTISVDEFINGYLQFEEDVRKNSEMFNRKLAEEKEIYLSLEEQCRRYKSEKLNKEGFCENAKISGEITDVDIRRRLEGIKEIIIKVVYNEKEKEIRFKIGGTNSNAMLNEKFEFHPTSRRDHFEFIMKGVNDRNQIFDIGSKVFPLNDVTSQEEYSVQIIIPEIDDEETIAAYINAKIILFWSDYKLYEAQRRKAEKRVKKLTEAAAKAAEYLRKVREIYGDLSKRGPDLLVDFNNERLLEKRGGRISVNFNNTMESNGQGQNYSVEFNNKRNVELKGPTVDVEFNNSKEVERNEGQVQDMYNNNIGEAEEPRVNENYNQQDIQMQMTDEMNKNILDGKVGIEDGGEGDKNDDGVQRPILVNSEDELNDFINQANQQSMVGMDQGGEYEVQQEITPNLANDQVDQQDQVDQADQNENEMQNQEMMGQNEPVANQVMVNQTGSFGPQVQPSGNNFVGQGGIYDQQNPEQMGSIGVNYDINQPGVVGEEFSFKEMGESSQMGVSQQNPSVNPANVPVGPQQSYGPGNIMVEERVETSQQGYPGATNPLMVDNTGTNPQQGYPGSSQLGVESSSYQVQENYSGLNPATVDSSAGTQQGYPSTTSPLPGTNAGVQQEYTNSQTVLKYVNPGGVQQNFTNTSPLVGNGGTGLQTEYTGMPNTALVGVNDTRVQQDYTTTSSAIPTGPVGVQQNYTTTGTSPLGGVSGVGFQQNYPSTTPVLVDTVRRDVTTTTTSPLVNVTGVDVQHNYTSTTPVRVGNTVGVQPNYTTTSPLVGVGNVGVRQDYMQQNYTTTTSPLVVQDVTTTTTSPIVNVRGVEVQQNYATTTPVMTGSTVGVQQNYGGTPFVGNYDVDVTYSTNNYIPLGGGVSQNVTSRTTSPLVNVTGVNVQQNYAATSPVVTTSQYMSSDTAVLNAQNAYGQSGVQTFTTAGSPVAVSNVLSTQQRESLANDTYRFDAYHLQNEEGFPFVREKKIRTSVSPAKVVTSTRNTILHRSLRKEIVHQSVKDPIMTQKTLPVKYLPDVKLKTVRVNGISTFNTENNGMINNIQTIPVVNNSVSVPFVNSTVAAPVVNSTVAVPMVSQAVSVPMVSRTVVSKTVTSPIVSKTVSVYRTTQQTQMTPSYSVNGMSNGSQFSPTLMQNAGNVVV